MYQLVQSLTYIIFFFLLFYIVYATVYHFVYVLAYIFILREDIWLHFVGLHARREH